MLPMVAFKIIGSRIEMTPPLSLHLAQADDPLDRWIPGEFDAGPSNPMIEKLVNDTHSAALLCATIASVANALREAGVPKSKAELQVYLPSNSGMAISLAVLGREANLSTRTHAMLLEFFGSFAPAQRATESFFNDTEIMGEALAVTMHQYALARAWRPVCKRAAEAIEALSGEVGDRVPELYTLSTGVLVRLLKSAGIGESPCVDVDGKPFLPPLPQRRRSDRRTLGQTAYVVSEGRLVRGFVRDVSQGGLGLDQISKLKEGGTVTIELETGRRFSGSVAWSQGNRAGIRFSVPLTPNDPLLWG